MALNYGHLTPGNVAFLRDIDENVEYDSMFAAGKGHLAALVAVAGVLFGNGLLYFAARRLYSHAKRRHNDVLVLFALMLCMMNVGNFLCYVPVRTFTKHADIATLEKGLHASPWWIVTVLGISVKQFCKEKGLTECSFYAWRKGLQERASAVCLVERSARRQELRRRRRWNWCGDW